MEVLCDVKVIGINGVSRRRRECIVLCNELCVLRTGL